jgi:hypothetical protein
MPLSDRIWAVLVLNRAMGGAEGDGLLKGGLVEAGDPVVFGYSDVDPSAGRGQWDDQCQAD